MIALAQFALAQRRVADHIHCKHSCHCSKQLPQILSHSPKYGIDGHCRDSATSPQLSAKATFLSNICWADDWASCVTRKMMKTFNASAGQVAGTPTIKVPV